MATKIIRVPTLDDHTDPVWEVALLFMAQHVMVLQLAGSTYKEHGLFARGTPATSALLHGFTVAVDAVLEAV